MGAVVGSSCTLELPIRGLTRLLAVVQRLKQQQNHAGIDYVSSPHFSRASGV